MMQTKYFLSGLHNTETMDRAVTQAEEFRDAFVKTEGPGIARISSETMQPIIFHNGQVRVLIILSFYRKGE